MTIHYFPYSVNNKLSSHILALFSAIIWAPLSDICLLKAEWTSTSCSILKVWYKRRVWNKQYRSGIKVWHTWTNLKLFQTVCLSQWFVWCVWMVVTQSNSFRVFEFIHIIITIQILKHLSFLDAPKTFKLNWLTSFDVIHFTIFTISIHNHLHFQLCKQIVLIWYTIHAEYYI